MKISLLTIGTEITTGEILNTNSHWMAERLEGLNIEIQHHVTVPDSSALILEALDFISSSDVLIVTGGLGPTQDDITREVVARWCGLKLEFNSEAWDFLSDYMRRKFRTPLEAHRHQCFFPEGAVVLKNEVGTAHGFLLKGDFKGRGEKILMALPGPPRELVPMWLGEVEPQLPKGGLTPWIKWVFQGLPESEVADRFERVLSEFVNPKTIEIGYRASFPHIHVKIREINVPKTLPEKIALEFGESLKSFNGALSKKI